MTDERLQRHLATSFEYYAQRCAARLVGLSDDEYFWEPVSGCWSVRSGDHGWVPDWADPEPQPPPVTTIAWRLVHTIYCLQDHGLRAVAFDRGSAEWLPPRIVPGSAADALDALEVATAAWRRDLAGVDDNRLWEPLGPEGGGFAEHPVVAFVEHIHDEFIHHTAEIALLRDLYRSRPRREAAP